MATIGEFLKKLRGDMPFREAAERSGLSHSYIRYLEMGKRPGSNTPINPTPETLKSLAKAYNYPYEELMKVAGYIEEKPPATKKELAEELLQYIETGLSDEEIRRRMEFFVDFIKLNDEQADEFMGWVRYQLSKKKEQSAASKGDEP